MMTHCSRSRNCASNNSEKQEVSVSRTRSHSISIVALAVLAYLAPATALACMDGEWYDINYQDGLTYLFIAGIALLCATAVQILSRRFKWYAPVIIAVVAYALPIIELLRWGSGDCGIVFLWRSQLSVFVAGAYLAYETFRLHQHFRLRREYEITRAKIEEFERKAVRRRDGSSD
jgi:uncharacterized membrane protein SirB2